MASDGSTGFLIRLLGLAGLWHVINAGELASWTVGAPVVLLAALLSRRLDSWTPARLRWLALAAFAVYFLRASFAGGLEVARRVFSPRLEIAPGFVVFTTSLPDGPARRFFVNAVSLLPGTLSSGLDGDRITVHAINADCSVEPELRELEAKLARVFRAPKEAAS